MPLDSVIQLFRNVGQELSNQLSSRLILGEEPVRRTAAVRYFARANHKFKNLLITEPTECAQCRKFIYIQGLRCDQCKLAIHFKCFKSLDEARKCRRSQSRASSKCEHKFESKTFWTPSFCNHCGFLLKGLRNQGYECDCSFKVHKECVELVCELSCQQIDNHNQESCRDTNQQEQQQLIRTNSRLVDNWGDISIRDFELIRILGKGSFSKVFLAKLRENNREYAIKVVRKTIVGTDPKSATTEMNALKIGRKVPFLAAVHCCFQSTERLFFVVEFVNGANLANHLAEARKFTEDRTKFHAAELVIALRYLHGHKIIHRDLKLENVIIDEWGHCKIIDFGLSRELTNHQKAKTFCGTIPYISPEILSEQEYDYSVDWWALGVMMFEMMTGGPPYDGTDEEKLYESILSNDIHYPTHLSLDAKNILADFLTLDPKYRLGCRLMDGTEEEILRHPFFKFCGDDGVPAFAWKDIECKQKRPPFRPRQPSPVNQETTVKITPDGDDEILAIDQSDFREFSFISSSFKAY